MTLPLRMLISDLQATLEADQVVLPGSDQYNAALKRWAASIEKPAVSSLSPILQRSLKICRGLSFILKLVGIYQLPSSLRGNTPHLSLPFVVRQFNNLMESF